jgi:hypothetical protein
MKIGRDLKPYVSLFIVMIIFFVITKKMFLIYSLFGIIGIALFIPLLNNSLLKYWNMLIHFIGRVNSYLLLSVTFLIFLVPIAVILRILKKSRFEGKGVSSKSYFITRDHIYEGVDMKELW